MSDDHPLIVELKKVQYDLTSLKARVSEIQRQVAALGLTDPAILKCPDCGIQDRSTAKLAEHRYYSHAGPLPDHIAAAEAIALEPEAPHDEPLTKGARLYDAEIDDAIAKFKKRGEQTGAT